MNYYKNHASSNEPLGWGTGRNSTIRPGYTQRISGSWIPGYCRPSQKTRERRGGYLIFLMILGLVALLLSIPA